MIPSKLAELTTDEVKTLLAGSKTAVLIPVGSVEPHGPHLMLGTDTLIGEHTAALAVELLRQRGATALIAPSIPYGVTNYASGFSGAITLPDEVLVGYLRAIAISFLENGFAHVCLVSNHLEPEHDAAVRKSVEGLGRGSVASPLTKRWGRTLSEEYKHGNCHAGRYETSLVMAAKGRVLDVRKTLPPVDTSLATAIREGKTSFADMGLHRAYTGSPADASVEEGGDLYTKLAEMVATEVLEGLQRN